MLDDQEKYNIIQLDLISKTNVEGFLTGLHSSPLHGFSVEFAEHKNYNVGDDSKNIDWRLFARTEKLYVKKFQEETNLRCHILIDTSSSMFYPEKENLKYSKIFFSILSTLSLTNLFFRQRDAVGLSLLSDDLNFYLKPSLGLKQKKIILSELEKILSSDYLRIRRQTNLNKSIDLISKRLQKKSLIIIFSDLLIYQDKIDDFFKSVNSLKFKKHEVIVFRTLDYSSEVDFNFDYSNYIFKDLESFEELKVNTLEMKKIYIDAMNKFNDKIKLKCLKYKIEYCEVDIKNGVKSVLETYLLKRKKML